MSRIIERPKRPMDFEAVFIQQGWRGVERIFGARTTVNLRWMDECGRDRLKVLRRRYMRGDSSALEEVKVG
jgi:hypothetical protein